VQGRRHRDPVGMADVAASGRNRGHDSVWVFWPRPARKDDPLGIVPGSYGWRVGFRIRFARARERFESNGRRKAAVRRSRESGTSCFSAAGKSLWKNEEVARLVTAKPTYPAKPCRSYVAGGHTDESRPPPSCCALWRDRSA